MNDELKRESERLMRLDYDAIDQNARRSFRRHMSGARGQMVVPQDSEQWHVFAATAEPLKGHIAKLQSELDAAASDIEGLIDSVTQLEAALDEARKDAERYRWLRDVECFVWPSIKRVELDEASSVSLWIQPDVAMDSEGIDAAIDAAMERQS